MKQIKLGRDVRVPASTCPQCNYEMDGATCSTGNHAPRPGDVSVCIQCASILEFDPDLSLRAAGPKLLASLDPDARAHLETIVAAIRKLHA
jgi:hypothetical protein